MPLPLYETLAIVDHLVQAFTAVSKAAQASTKNILVDACGRRIIRRDDKETILSNFSVPGKDRAMGEIASWLFKMAPT